MFAEYDNSEIGPLECEEIEGVLDPTSDILLEYADKFEKERRPVCFYNN
jgi:protein LTV1